MFATAFFFTFFKKFSRMKKFALVATCLLVLASATSAQTPIDTSQIPAPRPEWEETVPDSLFAEVGGKLFGLDSLQKELKSELDSMELYLSQLEELEKIYGPWVIQKVFRWRCKDQLGRVSLGEWSMDSTFVAKEKNWHNQETPSVTCITEDSTVLFFLFPPEEETPEPQPEPEEKNFIQKLRAFFRRIF